MQRDGGQYSVKLLMLAQTRKRRGVIAETATERLKDLLNVPEPMSHIDTEHGRRWSHRVSIYSDYQQCGPILLDACHLQMDTRFSIRCHAAGRHFE